MINQTLNTTSTESKFLKKTFAITGAAFLAICLIGYLTSVTLDANGAIKESLSKVGRFDFNMYSSLGGTEGSLRSIATLSTIAMGLIVVSSVLNMIWAFRALRASKTFIITTYAIYILAQGLGFGMLFLTWKATNLIALFGISGGIFLTMATIGYFSKNLMPLRKYLFYGSMIAMVLGMIMMIMFFSGVYSDGFTSLVFGLTGVLTIGWIAFDVWRIKQSQEFINSNYVDEDMQFRLTAWMSFRLLSDMITLIWVVARFMMRATRS